MKEIEYHQARIGEWKKAIMPREKNTPLEEYDRSIEEMAELQMAIEEHDGSRKSELHIGEEATDVIIRMLGIAETVNCNVSEMLEEKIKYTTEVKYSPDVIQPLMKRGIIFESAMHIAKDLDRRKSA